MLAVQQQILTIQKEAKCNVQQMTHCMHVLHINAYKESLIFQSIRFILNLICISREKLLESLLKVLKLYFGFGQDVFFSLEVERS